LTYNIFDKVITTKDGTNTRDYRLDTIQLKKLLNPTKTTKYKLFNLFNIVTATSFSKNLISFEIDFTNSPKNARVNFKYPLYNMLTTTKNNTIFGIHLENNEIELFKQIYENYIIVPIDALFKEPIMIPQKSNQHPKFYTLMTIKLMLKETYWKNYNICFINCKDMIPKYKKMFSDLNQYKQYNDFIKFDDIYTTEDKKLDQEAYVNELQIRKESEPNWNLLKDNEMKTNKLSTVKKYKEPLANSNQANS